MKAFSALIICILCVCASCNFSDMDNQRLQKVNNQLQAENDSLQRIIIELQQSPDETIQDAKDLIANGKRDSALILLHNLSARSLTAKNLAQISKLLKAKRSLQERKQAFAQHQTKESNDETINTIPVSGSDLKDQTANDNWKTDEVIPTVKRPAQAKTYTTRVGAICRDGTRSSATGRGACSHHGGVSEWVYE